MVIDCIGDGAVEYHSTPLRIYSNQILHKDLIIENTIPIGSFSYVKSIPKKIRNNLNFEILYYFDIYFTLFNIIVDTKDNLYQKIENSLFSYKYIGYVDDFILKHYYLIFQKIKELLFEFLNLSVLVFIFTKSYKKLIKQFKIFLNYKKK